MSKTTIYNTILVTGDLRYNKFNFSLIYRKLYIGILIIATYKLIEPYFKTVK